ncbi:MAG: hypothetical protein QXX70_01865 [Candidatus Micrarchaeaceae archaeon]
MATIITLDMAKKLRPLHKSRRRKQASAYVKGEIARRLKLRPENVKFSAALNRYIIAYLVHNPRQLKLSIDMKAGKATANLYLKEAASDTQQKPDNGEKQNTAQKPINTEKHSQ